jgi:hypothetical protein
MTAKEKALEIYTKVSPLSQYWDCYNDEPSNGDEAQQLCFIVIDEVLKVLEDEKDLLYWTDVRIEIETL